MMSNMMAGILMFCVLGMFLVSDDDMSGLWEHLAKYLLRSTKPLKNKLFLGLIHVLTLETLEW